MLARQSETHRYETGANRISFCLRWKSGRHKGTTQSPPQNSGSMSPYTSSTLSASPQGMSLILLRRLSSSYIKDRGAKCYEELPTYPVRYSAYGVVILARAPVLIHDPPSKFSTFRKNILRLTPDMVLSIACYNTLSGKSVQLLEYMSTAMIYIAGNQMLLTRCCVPPPAPDNACTLCAASKAAPPLIRTPFLAPTPVPTITAVGVARPKAQGQATTVTATAESSAKRKGSAAVLPASGSAR